MPAFVPGLELGRLLHEEAVRPLLYERFPSLEYAAALVGTGSEVLGFDDGTSTDHHWGPRVMLFVSEEAWDRHADAVGRALRDALPVEIGGWPTHFTPPDPDDNGVQLLRAVHSGPVNHRVEVLALRPWLHSYLGLDPRDGLQPVDWLTLPGQKLRTIVEGAVYHDGPGELTDVRARLAYYPDDVWLYLLAAGWTRVSQEEHLVGRAALAGDELGSRLIAARLVHDLMNLVFLMRRTYAPYAKWFGTAFARLPDTGDLETILRSVLEATTWADRERSLVRAWERVAEMHVALDITEPLSTACTPFHGRPLTVPHGERFATALVAAVDSDEIRRLASDLLLGSVEQLSTSTDLLCDARACRRLRALYEG